MKILTNTNRDKKLEGGIHMLHDYRGPVQHIPPHERQTMVYVEFDEQDWTLLKEVFGDEDTAAAAAKIIREAPPEIQILAVQVIKIIKGGCIT